MEVKKIKLFGDYCCGGGHCGPLPGYFYNCPYCDEETNFKTGNSLKLGEIMECEFCSGLIQVVKQYGEFEMDFELKGKKEK